MQSGDCCTCNQSAGLPNQRKNSGGPIDHCRYRWVEADEVAWKASGRRSCGHVPLSSLSVEWLFQICLAEIASHAHHAFEARVVYESCPCFIGLYRYCISALATWISSRASQHKLKFCHDTIAICHCRTVIGLTTNNMMVGCHCRTVICLTLMIVVAICYCRTGICLTLNNVIVGCHCRTVIYKFSFKSRRIWGWAELRYNFNTAHSSVRLPHWLDNDGCLHSRRCYMLTYYAQPPCDITTCALVCITVLCTWHHH